MRPIPYKLTPYSQKQPPTIWNSRASEYKHGCLAHSSSHSPVPVHIHTLFNLETFVGTAIRLKTFLKSHDLNGDFSNTPHTFHRTK